jgi:hypothetical protein
MPRDSWGVESSKHFNYDDYDVDDDEKDMMNDVPDKRKLCQRR